MTSKQIKASLRKRFDPIPLKVSDPELDGQLHVRRLRIPELRIYFDSIEPEKGKEAKDKGGRADRFHCLLLSMVLCDSTGARIFDTPEEVSEYLGDFSVEVLNQVHPIVFPGEVARGKAKAASKP